MPHDNNLIKPSGTYRQPIAPSHLVGTQNINQSKEQHNYEWAKKYKPSVFDDIDELLQQRR